MLLVTDYDLEQRLLAERRKNGGDRFDEVWEGTYVMAPMANIEHQAIQFNLASAFQASIGDPREYGQVFPGVNVSDRDEDWEHNYRCPDVAVYLVGNPAKDSDTHWLGGPDFAVEIVIRRDRSREKLNFYAGVGVRELMIIDRDPWTLEFYRLSTGALSSVAKFNPSSILIFESEVLPLTFRWIPGTPRPQIEVSDRNSSQKWLI